MAGGFSNTTTTTTGKGGVQWLAAESSATLEIGGSAIVQKREAKPLRQIAAMHA